MQTILDELHYKGSDHRPLLIHEDNRAAIDLAKNPEFHKRTKHVAVKHHFVREHVEAGTVVLQYKATADMVADGLTKALDSVKHQAFLVQLNMA